MDSCQWRIILIKFIIYCETTKLVKCRVFQIELFNTSFDQAKVTSSENIQSALTYGSPKTLYDLLLIVKGTIFVRPRQVSLTVSGTKRYPLKEAL